MAESALSKLTSEELRVVEEKQKSESSLPEYFSAALNTKVKITREFEAFLILASSDLKTSALTWIKNAVKLHQSNKLRDDLNNITIEQELNNAQLKISELDNQLQGFEDFRKNFQTNTVFSGVSEVQLFLSDLQRVIDELTTNKDRAFFDQTAAKVMQKFGDDVNISSSEIEELQSWTSVISPYLSG